MMCVWVKSLGGYDYEVTSVNDPDKVLPAWLKVGYKIDHYGCIDLIHCFNCPVNVE